MGNENTFSSELKVWGKGDLSEISSKCMRSKFISRGPAASLVRHLVVRCTDPTGPPGSCPSSAHTGCVTLDKKCHSAVLQFSLCKVSIDDSIAS